MAELNITLFGGLEVRRAAGGLVEIEGRKAKALLAYLAAIPGRQRSREQVCALLWGSRAEPQARGSLRQVLTLLRHSLSGLQADPLVTTRDQIWLDTSVVRVDAEEFARCLQLGTAEALARAVVLYRGTLLDGLEVREAEFESWLAGERYRFEEAATKACRMLLRQWEDSAEPQRLIEIAQRLIALDACDEEGHRTLMRLYAATGDAPLALRQYQICCDTLRDELGISPSPETEKLLNEIRRSRSRASPRSSQTPLLAGQAGPDVSPARQLGAEESTLLHGEAGNAYTQRSNAKSAALSVAVLPFANKSNDPTQSYFSDGIAEDIITELSRFRELAVLARSTSFGYRAGASDLTHAGRDLGVQYVVQGSVRRLGDRVRIATQLVSTELGHELWAEHFDRDQQEIFAVQDQIVRTVVGTLVGRLQTAGADQAKRKPPAILAAYEYVLRGKALPIGDVHAEAEARRMYEKAVEVDPSYGRAYALLAHAVSLEWFNDQGDSDVVLNQALELAKKAVALDPNDNVCQVVLGWVHLFRRSFDLAEQHYQSALELSPNSPEMLAYMGVLHTFLGRSDEAISWFRQAKSIDPFFEPTWYWHILGIAHFIEHRYREAISVLSRSATMPVWVRAYLAACHALLGRMDEARALTADVLRLKPDFSLSRLAGKEPYKRHADYELLVGGLRRAGLPE